MLTPPSPPCDDHSDGEQVPPFIDVFVSCPCPMVWIPTPMALVRVPSEITVQGFVATVRDLLFEDLRQEGDEPSSAGCVGFQQVVESNNTPLSTPMPFTAAFIPDPGLKTALPLASVQSVRSTSIHHSSLLTPHSSLLTPHSSLLTPHSSLLTPHSSLITPHSSLLLDTCPLLPHQQLFQPAACCVEIFLPARYVNKLSTAFR